MSEIDVKNCPSYKSYNVFGTNDEGCCYLYHKYCNEVDTCSFKELSKKLQQLKIDNEKLRFPREDIDFAVLTKEEFENYKRLKELEKNTTDATKCGFYHPEHGKECHIALAFADDYTDADHTYLLCEQNPNCYYKQLQQCKSKNEAIHFIADNLQKRNHRLTLKNEELEGSLECAELRNKYDKEKFDSELQQLRTENEELKEQYKLAEPLFQACKIKDCKIDKYKQCLDKIKEIILKRQKEHYCYCDECSPFKEILQLIKQAKGET